MGQDNKEKILELYYENPNREFTIREISSKTKIPKSSAHRILNELKKEGIISKDNVFFMNNLSKVKKINFYVEKIVECGLLDYLISELNPSLIILFGSIRKGDSIKESDIDIFIETCVDKKLDLKNFEKKLGHNIEIFLETDMNNLQKNLFNNIINGISLFGRVKVK
jgi:predicted nucleotidyltransferase